MELSGDSGVMYPPPPPRVPEVFDPVPVRPGHDQLCEVGRGNVLEECWCASRAWYAHEREDLLAPVEVPWGLFGFERGRPDTRGHDRG